MIGDKILFRCSPLKFEACVLDQLQTLPYETFMAEKNCVGGNDGAETLGMLELTLMVACCRGL